MWEQPAWNVIVATYVYLTRPCPLAYCTQVDNYDLWDMTPQESVARIKEKPVLTITVLRDVGHESTQHHIYDEIIVTDLSQQNLSQQDENVPPTPPPMDFGKFSPSAQPKLLHNGAALMSEDPSHRSQRLRPTSPAAQFTYKTSNSGQGEHTSKDSGLSSGSSDSPHQALRQTDPKPAVTRLTQAPTPGALRTAQNLDRDVKERPLYRTEREMVRTQLKNQRRNSPAPLEPISSSHPTRSRNCRIVGEYELEVSVYMTMWFLNMRSIIKFMSVDKCT